MLVGGPHVAQRHRPTLASVGIIVAERLPNIIKEHLFELNEVPQTMGVASTMKRLLVLGIAAVLFANTVSGQESPKPAAPDSLKTVKETRYLAFQVFT